MSSPLNVKRLCCLILGMLCSVLWHCFVLLFLLGVGTCICIQMKNIVSPASRRAPYRDHYPLFCVVLRLLWSSMVLLTKTFYHIFLKTMQVSFLISVSDLWHTKVYRVRQFIVGRIFTSCLPRLRLFSLMLRDFCLMFSENKQVSFQYLAKRAIGMGKCVMLDS